MLRGDALAETKEELDPEDPEFKIQIAEDLVAQSLEEYENLLQQVQEEEKRWQDAETKSRVEPLELMLLRHRCTAAKEKLTKTRQYLQQVLKQVRHHEVEEEREERQ